MTKDYARDLIERVVVTFAGGALSVLGTNGADITSLSVWQGAGDPCLRRDVRDRASFVHALA